MTIIPPDVRQSLLELLSVSNSARTCWLTREKQDAVLDFLGATRSDCDGMLLGAPQPKVPEQAGMVLTPVVWSVDRADGTYDKRDEHGRLGELSDGCHRAKAHKTGRTCYFHDPNDALRWLLAESKAAGT